MVRSGLRRIVSDALPTATIGEAGTYDELLARVQEQSWSVLVLDIALGDRNSLDLVPELLRIRPRMRIIALSMYSEHQFVVRALRVGVRAYLTKDRAPEELLRAIAGVLAGERYLSEDVARRLANHVAVVGSGTAEPHEQLSAREHEVFLLLAAACSVSDIAARLGLSVKTVSTYRTRILEKMGMSSNAELMRYAMQRSLTSPV
jgi:DNA-binding NarL/FixJ family response regulator